MVISGLSHLFPQRWQGALGRLGFGIAAATPFVPESTISAIGPSTLTDPSSILSVGLASTASAFDAYFIVKTKPQTDEVQTVRGVEPIKYNTSLRGDRCGTSVEIGYLRTAGFETVETTKLQQLTRECSD